MHQRIIWEILLFLNLVVKHYEMKKGSYEVAICRDLLPKVLFFVHVLKGLHFIYNIKKKQTEK